MRILTAVVTLPLLLTLGNSRTANAQFLNNSQSFFKEGKDQLEFEICLLQREKPPLTIESNRPLPPTGDQTPPTPSQPVQPESQQQSAVPLAVQDTPPIPSPAMNPNRQAAWYGSATCSY